MKYSINLFIWIVSILSGCQNSDKMPQAGDTLFQGSNLCQIVPPTNNLEVFDLDTKYISTQNDRAKNIIRYGKQFQGWNFSYSNPDINFWIYYSMDYTTILIHINDHWLRCENDEYFRLYSKGYLDGLYNFTYSNYLVKTSQKDFLVCRTYSASNPIAALHTLYFIIDLTDYNLPILYTVGSYGYCDNGIGDFNADGDLDVVLINQDSIYDPPLDPNNPKGEFRASTYVLKNGEIFPMEQEDSHLDCRFKTHNDSIFFISGNWFELDY